MTRWVITEFYTQEPSELQSMVLQGAGHDWAHIAHIYHSPSKSRHLGCKIDTQLLCAALWNKTMTCYYCNVHHSFNETKMLKYIYIYMIGLTKYIVSLII